MSFFGTKVAKTEDSNFEKSKEAYKSLSKFTKDMVKSVQQYLDGLDQLARASSNLGEDLNSIFYEAPRLVKAKSSLISKFTRFYDSETANFYATSIEPNVLRPLIGFQSEIDRLESVKNDREAALKEYDSLRASIGQSNTKDKVKAQENEQRLADAKKKYDLLNDDFIISVHSLQTRRSGDIGAAVKSFIAITSQYYSKISSNLDRLSQNYPKDGEEEPPKEAAKPPDVNANPFRTNTEGFAQ